MLSDEKYHLDEVSIAYCQSKDLERVLERTVGKSLFIYPRTKWFSAFSCSSVFCIPPPVKWSAVICQKNAKCIMIDEVEIWGGVHTTREVSRKYERIAYPNWGERAKEIILHKKKWLQN